MKWINTKNNLPKNEDVVLIIIKNKKPFSCGSYDTFISLGQCVRRKFYGRDVTSDNKVTHWMSIPTLPKNI